MSNAHLTSSMIERIQSQSPGWAFSAFDFAELGSRSAIDVNLHRMAAGGDIRRVMRGIYDCPRYSEILARPVAPEIASVAAALARKFGWQIQPTGEVALNQLGLSTQVPAQTIYLTDGPRRSYVIGKTQLQFKPATFKEAHYATAESGLLVQALKALGQDHIDDNLIARLTDKLAPETASKVLMETRSATGWVYDAIRRICEGAMNG